MRYVQGNAATGRARGRRARGRAPTPAAAPRRGGGAAPPPEAGGGGLTVQGLPLVKPPYGQISAIDLNTRRDLWQVAHGETPDTVGTTRRSRA